MYKYGQSPLECGHMFHKDCLSKWVTKDNPTKTLQRVELTDEKIIFCKEVKIYLVVHAVVLHIQMITVMVK